MVPSNNYIEGVLTLLNWGASTISRLKGVQKVGKEPLLEEFPILSSVGHVGPTSNTESMSGCFETTPSCRSPTWPDLSERLR